MGDSSYPPLQMRSWRQSSGTCLIRAKSEEGLASGGAKTHTREPGSKPLATTPPFQAPQAMNQGKADPLQRSSYKGGSDSLFRGFASW